MAIRYIGNDIDGVDVDTSGDFWILGRNNTLSNAADAFDFLTFTGSQLAIEGAIFSEADGVDSDTASANNSVVVSETGSIIAASDGIEMAGDNHEVINNGEVTGLGDRGIQMIGDGSRVTNTGAIFGTSDGISMEGDNGNVFNSGIVTSDNEAINIDGTGNEVVNTGILSAIDHGVEFNTLTSEVNVLVNSGRIESSNLSNPTVRGDFGDETVVNSGLIVGSVSLGAGNDVFNGRGGTVTGSILGGAGDDLFIIDPGLFAQF